MNKPDFGLLLIETHERMKALTEAKGEEYSRDDDQLANFKRAGREAGIRPEQAWLVFFNKHADAIKTYIYNEGGGSEPIEGRIDDAILYLCLLKGLVRERPQQVFGMTVKVHTGLIIGPNACADNKCWCHNAE